MFRMIVFYVLSLVMAGCGSINDATGPASADVDVSSNHQTRPSDSTIPIGNLAVVAAANWTDPIGSLATIDTSNNYLAREKLISTDGSDIVVRSFYNVIYIISRFGTDTIQVIDPKSFGVIADYSVGGGSNPQDIWVVSNEKAYITRLNPENDNSNTDDIIIVRPFTGEVIGSIDLTSYTTGDGERYARTTQMIVVGGYLFVCMADLPFNLANPADTNAKIAVIDITDDEIVDVIELSGRNAADITYSPATNLIYVSLSGVYENFTTDVNDHFGGIETVDPDTLISSGIVIDDKDLGGYPTEVHLLSSGLGMVIAEGKKITSFNPTTFNVLNENFYLSPGSFLPDFSIDQSGNILVTERSPDSSGIVVLNGDGVVVSGPIGVGAMPASITFVDIVE